MRKTLGRSISVLAVLVAAVFMSLLARPVAAASTVESSCVTPMPTSALNAVRAGAIGTNQQTISNPHPLPTPRAGVAFAGQPVTINVFIHVVQGPWIFWSGSDLSQARIDQLIDVLNQSFSGATGGTDTGFRFVLAGVTRRLAFNNWEYGVSPGTGDEIYLKSDREGSYADLNIWTLSGHSRLGWATMPVTAPNPDTVLLDGVVANEVTLPGSLYPDLLDGYGEGDSAVHLVGNWLGLYNTFQNACKAPGDYVDDTPPESGPAVDCPEGQDSCLSSAGLDPIHNFMDMSSDACRYAFTEGQAARAQALWRSLRLPPPPTVTSFSRTSGRPNTAVLIKGTDLFYLKSVEFNGTPASRFGRVSATEVEADVPYGATTGPITVTTDTGSATSTKSFTVIAPAPPEIKHLVPATTYPGAVLVILGVGLTGATDVSFNGISVPGGGAGYGWQVVSDTKITLVVPDGVTDGPLTVTTPAGSASAPFTVAPFPVPTIASVSPGGATVGYGPVTIRGKGFYRVSSVEFDGVEAADFFVHDSGLITATVPDGATTGPVTVIQAGAAAVSRRLFAVLSDARFEACLGGSTQVPAGTVPYLQLTYSVLTAFDGKTFLGATRTTLTVNGVAVGGAGKYWSKTAYPDNPYDHLYWTFVPGVLLGNPGNQLVVTFDVVAKKTFSDGIRVHYQGEHVIGPATCTIVAT